MKFLLTIQICSVLMQECTEPIKVYPLYNSYYDCSTGGFLRGLTLLRQMGLQDINSKRILLNFTCTEQPTV